VRFPRKILADQYYNGTSGREYNIYVAGDNEDVSIVRIEGTANDQNKVMSTGMEIDMCRIANDGDSSNEY